VGAANGAAAGLPGAAGSPLGTAAGTIGLPSAAASAPRPGLNLSLPRTQPAYPYRPPVATPQRSLSQMANEKLGNKPRDPMAEGIDAAGDIDCLKGPPEGTGKGLLGGIAVAIALFEQKCKR